MSHSHCKHCHNSENHNQRNELNCACEKENSLEEKREKIARFLLIIGAAFFAAAIVFQVLSFSVFSKVLYVLAYLCMGFDTFCELAEDVREKEFFGENTLMTVSSVGAMIIGEMAEGCAVMLLFAIGEILEHKAQNKSKKNIEALLALKPKYAERILPNGEIQQVTPEKLNIGDFVLVKAGDTVPCDGEVYEGAANADTSSITGESAPVSLEAGDCVRCGYISLDGILRIKVTAAYADNTFSKILEIISNADAKKSQSESFVSKFAKIYTPCVMIAAFLVMVAGTFLTGKASVWIYRGLVFLATSCPCAFVISIPLTFFFGIGEMTKKGLLVKGSEYIEKLSKLKTVAFDKTGTVTKGELNVVNIVASEEVEKDDVLALCASLEMNSNHPIGTEIVKLANEKKLKLFEVFEVREMPGVGIRAKCNGSLIFIGNAKVLKTPCGFELSDNTTKVFVVRDEKCMGVIELADEIKPESSAVIENLRKFGIEKTVMLTGDSSSGAEKIASLCKIDEVYAGLEPQEKSQIFEKRVKGVTDGTSAFVGDGINDAPVLALADVGVAVGGTGAELSIETADAVILGSSLEAFSNGVRASQIIMSRVKFNVIFAIAVKLAILVLTLFGFANMGLAVFGDVGVTIIVILNSLRKL